MKLKFRIARGAENLQFIPRLATIRPKTSWMDWFTPEYFIGFVNNDARTRLEKVPVFDLCLFKSTWAGYNTQEQFITHLISGEPSEIEVLTMANKISVNWAKKGDGANKPSGGIQFVGLFAPKFWKY